jgi:1-aminocyclopropane-1-carboxylate deaminase/D-cysteine desulfhydrase-like pyridoxal-dependent ACC family enzyme
MVSGSDLKLVEGRCREMVEEMGAFCVDQFNDRGCADAHYFGTAREILEQCDGRLDAFVDFVGTAGTFAGCRNDRMGGLSVSLSSLSGQKCSPRKRRREAVKTMQVKCQLRRTMVAVVTLFRVEATAKKFGSQTLA